MLSILDVESAPRRLRHSAIDQLITAVVAPAGGKPESMRREAGQVIGVVAAMTTTSSDAGRHAVPAIPGAKR